MSLTRGALYFRLRLFAVPSFPLVLSSPLSLSTSSPLAVIIHLIPNPHDPNLRLYAMSAIMLIRHNILTITLLLKIARRMMYNHIFSAPMRVCDITVIVGVLY